VVFKIKLHKNNPVLHLFKIETLALRKDHGLNVLVISTPTRIFGPKSDEVAAGWSKLHIYGKEPHILYPSPSAIRIILSIAYVSCMGQKRNAYKILVRKLEEKLLWSQVGG
jgi:hypothetical protein